MKHGKRYASARAQVDRERAYTPLEAVRLLKSLETAAFDETVETHFNLGLNTRHADQQLRGTLMLPNGTGREMRVAVFAEGEKAGEAREAGADVVGSADLAQQIEGGFDEFDIAVATPDMMGTVGKLGRILGPRGKMPNPKSGTVTFDVAKAVREAKAGKLEYRTDRGAQRPRAHREEELRRAAAARELRRRRRGDHAGEACCGQGPLHPQHHCYDVDGPRDQGRSREDPRHHGRARGGRCGRVTR